MDLVEALAALCGRLGDHEAAAEHAARALALDSSRAHAVELQVQALIAQDDMDGALDVVLALFRDAGAEDLPDVASLAGRFSSSFDHLGRAAGALLKRLPDHAPTLWLRGTALAAAGRDEEARADLEAGLPPLQGDPVEVDLVETLAEVCGRLGDHERSAELAASALALDPSRGYSAELRVRALVALDRAEEALEVVRTAVEAAPDEELPALAAMAGELRTSPEHLAIAIGDVLARLPDHAPSLWLRGSMRASLRQDDDARDDLEAGLPLSQGEPYEVDLIETLAGVVARLGDLERAAELATRALDLDAGRDHAARIRVRSLVALENPEAALEAVKALYHATEDADLPDVAALAGELAPHTSALIEASGDVLRRLPDHAPTLWLRGSALADLGRDRDARVDLETGLALSEGEPFHVDLLEALAAVCARLDDPEAADRFARLALALDDARDHAVELRVRAKVAQGDPGGAADVVVAAVQGAADADLDRTAGLLGELSPSPGHVVTAAAAVLERAPDHAPTLWLRGATLADLGRDEDARQDLEAGLPTCAGEPFEVELVETLAAVCGRLGDHERAAELAARALDLDGSRQYSAELRVRALVALDRADEALDVVRAAVASASDADLPAVAGTVAELQASPDHLVRAADDVLARSPDHAQTLWLRGSTHADLGEDDGALADLEACLPLCEGEPFEVDLHEALAAVLARRGDHERAAEHAARAQAADSGRLFSAQVRASALVAQGQVGEALEAVRAAIRGASDEALAGAADLITELLAFPDETIAAAEEVLQRLPDHTTAAWLRGSALAGLHRDDEALADLERCLDGCEGAPYEVELYEAVAAIHLRRGDHEEAVAFASRALDASPSRPYAADIQTRALLAAERTDEAAEILRAALDGADAGTILTLAHLFHDLSRAGEAATVLDLADLALSQLARTSNDAQVARLAAAAGGYDIPAGDAAPLGEHRSDLLTLVRRRLEALHSLGDGAVAATCLEDVLRTIADEDLLEIADLVAETHREERFDAVEILAGIVLDVVPDHVDSRWFRGSARARSGRRDEALEDLTACLDQVTGHRFEADLRETAAELLLARSDHEGALEQAVACLAVEPDRAHTMEIRARALLAVGRDDEGAAAILEAFDGVGASGILARAHLVHPLLDAARYTEALEVSAHLIRALRAAKGAAARAAHVLERGRPQTKRLAPRTHREALLAAARSRTTALFRLDRADEATAALGAVFDGWSRRDAAELADLVFEAHRLEDWEAVVTLADRLAHALPDDATARWLAGTARAKLGQDREAAGDLEASLGLDLDAGRVEGVHALLVDLYMGLDEYEAAMRHAPHVAGLAFDPSRRLEDTTLARIASGDLELAAQALVQTLEALDACAEPGARAAQLVYLLHDLAEGGLHETVLDLADRLSARLDATPPVETVVALARLRFRALSALDRGDEAVAGLTDVFATASDEALSELEGLLYEAWHRVDFTAMEGLASALVTRDDGLAHARWMRGESRRRTGDSAGARIDIEACLDTAEPQPFAAEAHEALAELALEEGRWDDALGHADMALDSTDRSATHGLEIRARALTELGRADEAEAAARACLASADGPWALDLAYLLRPLVEGRRSEGIADACEAILRQVRDADAEPAAVRAVADAVLGGSGAAEASLGARLAPMVALVRTVAAASLALDRADDAARAVRRLLGSLADPDVPAGAALLTDLPLGPDPLLDLASVVLERVPDHADTLWLRSSLLQDRGEDRAALVDLRAVLAALDDDAPQAADAWQTAAELEHAQGEHERVLDCADRALELGGGRVRCLELRALALLELGRPAGDAVSECIAAAFDEDNLGPFYLVHPLAEAGDHDTAVELAAQLAAAMPVEGEPWLMVARVHVLSLLATDRVDEAAEVCVAALDRIPEADLQRLFDLLFHFRDRDAAQAVEQLASTVLGRLPDHEEARRMRVVARQQLADLDGLIQDVDDYLDRHAGSPFAEEFGRLRRPAHVILAGAMFEAREHEGAIHHAAAALALEAQAEESPVDLLEIQALALIALCRLEEADEAIRAHTAAVGEPTLDLTAIVLQRLQRAFEEDRTARAGEFLVALLGFLPADEAGQHGDLVFEAHRRDAWDIVDQATAAVLDRAPGQAFFLWIRGAALGKLGRLDEAREALLAVLDTPLDGREGFEDAVYDTLAEVCLLQGDHAAARDHAVRALEISPGKPESERTLAAAREALGES